MKKASDSYYFIILLLLASFTGFSQVDTDSVYKYVDVPPEFPGGSNALIKYLGQTILYPQQAIDDSIEGKVYVSFVVEKDGSISEIRVLKGIGHDCDEEAVRVVATMPKWKSGEINETQVRTELIIPIAFKLKSLTLDTAKIYYDADTMPSFMGGLEALRSYMVEQSALSTMKDSLRESVIVSVYFVVETDGSISNITIIDSVDFKYKEEALKYVKNMPKWNPGKIGNTNVRVMLSIPIDFSVYTVVESMPEFPGGMQKLLQFLAENIQYPKQARSAGISGRVFANFVIEPDGSVSNVRILRGLGYGCDEEVIRVIKKMPKWNPGVQRGKRVRVSYNLPVKFTL